MSLFLLSIYVYTQQIFCQQTIATLSDFTRFDQPQNVMLIVHYIDLNGNAFDANVFVFLFSLLLIFNAMQFQWKCSVHTNFKYVFYELGDCRNTLSSK